MKKYKYLFLSATLFLLTNCTHHLPFDMGNGYLLDYDGNFMILNDQNTIMIDDKIIDFDVDSTFIIVKQKPIDSIFVQTFITDSIRIELEQQFKELKENNPVYYRVKLRNKAYSLIPNDDDREKLINESPLYYYWIIDKTIEGEMNSKTGIRSNTHGPYSYEEFCRVRNTLQVSELLKFYEEKSISWKIKNGYYDKI